MNISRGATAAATYGGEVADNSGLRSTAESIITAAIVLRCASPTTMADIVPVAIARGEVYAPVSASLPARRVTLKLTIGLGDGILVDAIVSLTQQLPPLPLSYPLSYPGPDLEMPCVITVIDRGGAATHQ